MSGFSDICEIRHKKRKPQQWRSPWTGELVVYICLHFFWVKGTFAFMKPAHDEIAHVSSKASVIIQTECTISFSSIRKLSGLHYVL